MDAWPSPFSGCRPVPSKVSPTTSQLKTLQKAPQAAGSLEVTLQKAPQAAGQLRFTCQPHETSMACLLVKLADQRQNNHIASVRNSPGEPKAMHNAAPNLLECAPLCLCHDCLRACTRVCGATGRHTPDQGTQASSVKEFSKDRRCLPQSEKCRKGGLRKSGFLLFGWAYWKPPCTLQHPHNCIRLDA